MKIILLIGVGLACVSARCADLACVFAEKMVLQSDRVIPVWGKGTPGEKVSVTFRSQKAGTKVGADGRWEVTLKPEKPAVGPSALTVVSDAGTRTIREVRVGDVYFIIGDVHARWPFWTCGSEIHTDAEREADSHLVYACTVFNKTSVYPLDDLYPADGDRGTWSDYQNKGYLACLPYFYARARAIETKMPVGVIVISTGSYRRGDARTFMSPEAYTKSVCDAAFAKKYEALSVTGGKGLAEIKKSVATIRNWAVSARALPVGAYPSSNMPMLPGLEAYDEVTSRFNYQLVPFLKTQVKGAVYAVTHYGTDPREKARAAELEADLRAKWGAGLAFTAIDYTALGYDVKKMKGDAPVTCSLAYEIVKKINAAKK